MSNDSIFILQLSRQGTTVNVFPPLVVYVQHIFDSIWPGSGLLFVFQVALYLGSCAAILIGARTPLWISIPGLTFLSFSPGILGPLLVVWKDVFFAGLLFFAVLLIQKFESSCNSSVSSNEKKALTKKQIFLLITTLCCFVAAAGYRHNGISAVFPLLCFTAFRYYRGNLKQTCLTTFLITLVVGQIAIFLSLYRLPDGKPLSGCLPAQSWTFDLIGISAFSGKNLLPAQFYRKYSSYSPEDVRNAYFPDNEIKSFLKIDKNQKPLDAVVHHKLIMKGKCRQAGGDSLDARTLNRAYRHAVMQNFGAYLQHRGTFILEFLGIGKTVPNDLTYAGIEKNDLGIEGKKTALTEAMLNYLNLSQVWITAFPWFYYLAGLVVLVAALFKRPAGCHIVVMLIASSLLTLVPLMILSPTSEQRYHEWGMASITMAAILYLNALWQAQKSTSVFPAIAEE